MLASVLRPELWGVKVSWGNLMVIRPGHIKRSLPTVIESDNISS